MSRNDLVRVLKPGVFDGSPLERCPARAPLDVLGRDSLIRRHDLRVRRLLSITVPDLERHGEVVRLAVRAVEQIAALLSLKPERGGHLAVYASGRGQEHLDLPSGVEEIGAHRGRQRKVGTEREADGLPCIEWVAVFIKPSRRVRNNLTSDVIVLPARGAHLAGTSFATAAALCSGARCE